MRLIPRFLIVSVCVLPNDPEVLLVSLLSNLRHDLYSSNISAPTDVLCDTHGAVGHQILEHNLNSVLP